MLIGLLVSLISGMSLAGFGIAISYYTGKGLEMFRFLFWNALITSVICFFYFGNFEVLAKGEEGRVWELVWWVTGGGVLSISGSLFLQQAMRYGNNNLIWAMLQGAMLIPFASGVVFFAQRCGIFQVLGALCICGGLVFPVLRENKLTGGTGFWKWVIPAVCALLFTGGSEAMQSVPSYWANWSDVGNLRPMLAYLGGSLGSLGGALVLRRKLWPLERRVAIPAFMVALLNVVTVLTMFKSLDICSSYGRGAICYPVMIGTSMIVFSLYSIFIMREKTSPLHYAGLATAFLGICVIAL